MNTSFNVKETIGGFLPIFQKAKQEKKYIFICGNGGSACNSEHFAEDLLSLGLRAIALTNIGNITAIGNDFGYQYIFSRQIDVLANEDDILVTLSCSGTSPNVVEAQKKAVEKKMTTVIFPTNKETGLTTPDTETVHQEIIHRIYKGL